MYLYAIRIPRFLHHISASALQFLLNQVFGLGVFFLLSLYLDKTHFGELNWTLAVFLTVFNILGAGLDQLTVKKMAAGASAAALLSIYKVHVWVAGLGFYGLLWLSACGRIVSLENGRRRLG